MLILVPIAAMPIQLAISRSREFDADADADAASAQNTGDPHNLISALGKLEAHSHRLPTEATPSTGHLFIVQPFTGQAPTKLFSTHPSTPVRSARLQALRASPIADPSRATPACRT